MILNYKSGWIGVQVLLSSFPVYVPKKLDVEKQLLLKLKKAPISLKSTFCVLRLSEKQL